MSINTPSFAGTSLTWLSVSLVTGEVIAELPNFQCTSVEYHLMETTTASGELPWDGIPVNWYDALLPRGVALLLAQDGVPLWGGVVKDAKRTPSGESIAIQLETIECYLDSCPVGDVTYTQESQTQIVADLIQRFAITDMRNCLTVASDASSTLRDRQYKDSDDKSVLSAIQELSNVINGPEWGCWWRQNGSGGYECAIRVCDHYGSTAPVTGFDLMAMTDFSVDYEYSSGSGANRVRAVSTAEGDVRPTSGWITSDDSTRPVWSYSYTPSTSITSTDTLLAHAQAKLDALRNGTRTLVIALDLLSAPKLGVEWFVGDVVYWDVGDAADRFPDLSSSTARVIGFQISWSESWTLTPILQEVDDGG
ncbi:MAG: hypothetical protein LKI88_00855 [Bifidobacterium sp.]|jgi:hypothetical protein|nr:hypothetical protein [Bifidobacterium sp.]MCI1864479.1 hypothetical protein [Bifidobacterium sp.]